MGFGAQSLVKDVITGFFLLFENQFSVGERVTIDNFTGTVKELGLRSTKIHGDEGGTLTIPNGSITKVVNHSRD
jgi:small conductance mechanosensitive channel